MRFSLALVTLLACAHDARPPAIPTTSKPVAPTFSVDAMIEAEWKKAGISPAARVDDAQWLRRAHIDLVGSLPEPELVTKFAADAATDKRAKMVDKLLADPRFVQRWTDYWDEELIGRTYNGRIDRGAFRAWLKARIQENKPWNELVLALVTASGQQSSGGARNPFAAKEEEPGVNGAVNYLLKFESPNDLAGSVSRTFLGVQIQCAQCHDHKTEKWKQDDFRKFASCFTRVRVEPVDRMAKMGINKLVVDDMNKPAPRFKNNPEIAPVAAARPTTLDGVDLGAQENVRKALGSWITSKENPWFAKEAVNRLWAHFLGRGFVDPVDDLRPGNPPEATELFDALAKDFVEHGYDTKRLMKSITLSEPYALASGNSPKLWSQFRLVPLGPSELVGALFAATDLDELQARSTKQDPEEVRQRLLALTTFVFDVDEEFDKPSYEGTITQALVFMNGRATAGGTTAIPGTTLAKMIAEGATDEHIVENLYLRTVSRKPTTAELGRAVQYIADAKVKPPPPKITVPPAVRPTPRQGEKPQLGPDPLARVISGMPQDARTAALEDVFWSLLNSSEFFFNH